MKTYNIGIFKVFQITNLSFRSDIHPEDSKNRYYYLQDTLECDLNPSKHLCSIQMVKASSE